MWLEQRIDQLAEIVSGGTPSREIEEYWDGDIPWVTPTDITRCGINYLSKTEEKITNAGLKNSSAKILPKGAILFTSRATVGESRIADREVCTNQGFKSLIPKQGIDSAFLYYSVLLNVNSFKRYAVGSTFPEINKKDTSRVELKIPDDYKVQKVISNVIVKADEAIEKTQALIAKYENIKQGMMQDLFSRGVDENGQLRPSYEDAPHLYQETELGWIPKDWEFCHLEEISNKVTDGDHHTPIREEHGIYLLSARNVGKTAILLDDVDYVGQAEYERMIKRCHPEEEDILISCSGTVGRVCIVPNWLKCALVRSAALVKQDRDKIEAKYLMWLLRSEGIQHQIQNSMFQAAQPNLFQGAINKLQVIIPSRNEQIRISLRLDSIQSAIESEEAATAKLKALKYGLMQDLLTGNVRVAEDVDECREAVA